jgi:hypothetical protein
MIDSERLLQAVSTKVKPWIIEKTFETALEAKQFGAKLFTKSAGVKVSHFAGGCFTVLRWIR